MFDRKAIKAQAQQLLKGNYWKMVVAGLAFAVGSGTALLNNGGRSAAQQTSESVSQNGTVVVAGIIVLIIGLLIRFFVMNPLEYGGEKFFIDNIDSNGEMSSIGEGWKSSNLQRIILTFLYRDLMILLYTLLLVIPGIIKAYEYYFVPQLLVEYPDKSAKEICEMSKQITNGNKMELLKFDLSFILWSIASSLTYGLVGIFWSNPYKYQAGALIYKKLMAESNESFRPAM